MVKIRDILDLLRADGEISFRGKEDAEITGFSSVTNYQAGTVTWCKTAETAGRMAAGTMRFKLVIMPPSPQLPDNFENIIIKQLLTAISYNGSGGKKQHPRRFMCINRILIQRKKEDKDTKD